MGDLKPNSHKQFNEFIKAKVFKGRNNYKLKELKAKFGFKPVYDRRRTSVISSKDMKPTEFESMRKAAKAIGIGQGVIRYVRNNGRNFLKDKNGKVFYKVVPTLSHIKYLTVHSKIDFTCLARE